MNQEKQDPTSSDKREETEKLENWWKDSTETNARKTDGEQNQNGQTDNSQPTWYHL